MWHVLVQSIQDAPQGQPTRHTGARGGGGEGAGGTAQAKVTASKAKASARGMGSPLVVGHKKKTPTKHEAGRAFCRISSGATHHGRVTTGRRPTKGIRPLLTARTTQPSARDSWGARGTGEGQAHGSNCVYLYPQASRGDRRDSHPLCGGHSTASRLFDLDHKRPAGLEPATRTLRRRGVPCRWATSAKGTLPREARRVKRREARESNPARR